MGIQASVRRYSADVARAFDRAPVECVLTVLAAAILSYAIEDGDMASAVAHLMVAALMIAGISWAATLAHAMGAIGSRQRWTVTLAGGACGALYMLLTHDIDLESEAWRAALLVGASALTAFATPGFVHADGDASLRLRRINSRILVRGLGITLYGLALFAGLAIALGAINNLFELKIDGKIYGHVYIWIMVVLVPWVVIGGLDEYVRPIDEQNDVIRVVFKLATYLLPPLVAIYFLILCAYVIRIAMTHEMPKNLVSPMVLAAGLLSCAACIVFDPRRDTSAGTRWLRFTPILFLVLSPLAWWALHVREADYGWTEFRLFRMVLLTVLVGLAAGGVVQLLKGRTLSLRIIPAALAAAAVLAATGPWGILSVARRSQQHRLAAGMTAAGLDARAPISKSDTSSRVIRRKTYLQIESSASYLESHFGTRSVVAIIPAYAGHRSEGVARVYRLAPDSAASPEEQDFSYASMRPGRSYPTPDGDAYRLQTNGAGRAPNGTRQDAWTSHDTVFALIGGDTITIALAPVIDAMIPDQHGNSMLPATAASVPAVSTRGEPRGYLTLIDLSVRHSQGERTITNASGILMLKGRTP